MRLCLILVALQSLLACLVPAAELPAGGGPEGRRAFADRGAWYRDGTAIDLSGLWRQLRATALSERQRAGQYLLALCQQSLADEGSRRDTFSRGKHPGFGERPRSSAREFRKYLARELAEHGAVVESLLAIGWLLAHDILAETSLAGTSALQQIRGPAADAMLLSLLSPPHPHGAVLTMAIEEVAARNLAGAAAPLALLAGDYRSDVRRAAQSASARLGLGNLPAYSPEEALTRVFDADLRQIAAMVLTPIPAVAPFVRLTIDLRPSDPRLPRTEAVYGWLLRQAGDTYHVFDEYAQEGDLPKNRTTFVPTTLAARAQELRQIREEEARAAPGVGDGSRSLSRQGGFSGQFEPAQLRLPEILIGVWAYQRQDKKSAAALLLPRFEELADRRWPREIARDLLGHDYHQQMLTRWADYWDYPGTLRLAKHLTSALFDDYPYQARAARLVEQVPRRAEPDFHTLVLPTPAQWHRQRRHAPSRSSSSWTGCV